jgi:rare lipoprotein A
MPGRAMLTESRKHTRRSIDAVPLVVLLRAAVGLCMIMPSLAQERLTQTGVASYYAEEFHGRKTANGEVYNMNALTAAHQTFPFNSLVRVTNLANRKVVVVRVNDAGPFVDDRIIDLSYAAAKKLGMIRTGKTQVRLDVIGNADPDHAESSTFYRMQLRKAVATGFAVQLASFTDLDNLIRRLDEFGKKGVEDLHVQIATVKGEKVHRLVSVGYKTRALAEHALDAFERKGIKGFVFQIR